MIEDFTMKRLLPFLGIFPLSLYPVASSADVLKFLCSWDNTSGVSFTVDTTTLIATRDDGGVDYAVLKITEDAVFISPKTPYSYHLTVQILERPSGGWHDIFVYNDGKVSAINGGTCIERK